MQMKSLIDIWYRVFNTFSKTYDLTDELMVQRNFVRSTFQIKYNV